MSTTMSMEDLYHQRLLLEEYAKHDFWTYCKLLAPDFYNDFRFHLRQYCYILQAFHENRIIRPAYKDDYDRYGLNPQDENGWMVVDEFPDWDYIVCRDMSISMPPRMGKSRTLVLFESWILGKSTKTKFITGSYNDDMAADFSRYVRDTISKERAEPVDVIFQDIFPGVRLDRTHKSVGNWALEGSHFNYLGAGVGGSVTGKGCDYLIVDDPVKSAEDAYNETYMQRVWLWFSSTLPSRLEGDFGKTILNLTRWPGGDPKERVKNLENADKWYHHDMPACLDEKRKQMLCPDMLSFEKWADLRLTMDTEVFYANYQQKILHSVGALYQKFQTYTQLPMDEKGKLATDMKIMYCDVADRGDDYLCAVFGDVVYTNKGNFGYITDVYFTPEPIEVTEEAVADKIIDNSTYYCIIESNNGGRAFALNVERILHEKGYHKCIVDWFHQSDNKRSRLITNATNVTKFLYFPEDWMVLWPEYYEVMTTFQRKWLINERTAKTKHDDGPDGTTGFYEKLDSNVGIFF